MTRPVSSLLYYHKLDEERFLDNIRRLRMHEVQKYCVTLDLVRFRRQELMPVDSIQIGKVYAWEPYKSHACALLKVISITEHPNGDVVVETKTSPTVRAGFNDMSRCQEAFVKTRPVGVPFVC